MKEITMIDDVKLQVESLQYTMNSIMNQKIYEIEERFGIRINVELREMPSVTLEGNKKMIGRPQIKLTTTI